MDCEGDTPTANHAALPSRILMRADDRSSLKVHPTAKFVFVSRTASPEYGLDACGVPETVGVIEAVGVTVVLVDEEGDTVAVAVSDTEALGDAVKEGEDVSDGVGDHEDVSEADGVSEDDSEGEGDSVTDGDDVHVLLALGVVEDVLVMVREVDGVRVPEGDGVCDGDVLGDEDGVSDTEGDVVGDGDGSGDLDGVLLLVLELDADGEPVPLAEGLLLAEAEAEAEGVTVLEVEMDGVGDRDAPNDGDALDDGEKLGVGLAETGDGEAEGVSEGVALVVGDAEPELDKVSDPVDVSERLQVLVTVGLAEDVNETLAEPDGDLVPDLEDDTVPAADWVALEDGDDDSLTDGVSEPEGVGDTDWVAVADGDKVLDTEAVRLKDGLKVGEVEGAGDEVVLAVTDGAGEVLALDDREADADGAAAEGVTLGLLVDPTVKSMLGNPRLVPCLGKG